MAHISFIASLVSDIRLADNDTVDHLTKATCALACKIIYSAATTWQSFIGMQSVLALFPCSTMTTFSIVTNIVVDLWCVYTMLWVLGYSWTAGQCDRSPKQRMCLPTPLVNYVTVLMQKNIEHKAFRAWQWLDCIYTVTGSELDLYSFALRWQIRFNSYSHLVDVTYMPTHFCRFVYICVCLARHECFVLIFVVIVTRFVT